MGATLDETRLELEAQRAKVRGTADQLETATRRSLDLKAAIGRNPGKTIGLAAGAAFFLLGGPRRTVRFVRRSLGGSASGEKAYAALPSSLRAFVDASAPGFGDSKTQAKQDLALALHAWRENPKNRKKADKLVSETLAPPGPGRAFWAMVEVAGVTAATIVARQVVGPRLARGAFRSLMGSGGAKPTAAGQTKAPAESPPSPSGPGTAPRAADIGTAALRASEPTGYTGWSGRTASVAGPSRPGQSEPTATTKP